MKVKVNFVGKPWLPSPAPEGMKPLYTIGFEGYPEPKKTYDTELAVMGEHEAEEYQSKTGKTYWRLTKNKPAQKQFGTKEFKADPLKQDSIEWQACLKAAVETVRDYYLMSEDKPKDLSDYKKSIVNALITFKATVDHKPKELVDQESTYDEIETITDAGDFAMFNNDLPPIENYDEQGISLDDIPF